MQTKIFDIPPIRIKRPSIDNINFDEAYNEMAEEILDWLKDPNCTTEEIVSDLKENFQPYELENSDGYELAKEFESNYGYDADTELVNIMDGFSHIIYTACKKAERKWVQDCRITPKYSIGDKVHVSHKAKIYEGEIADIKNDLAEYVIYVQDLGHVKEGVGTHGLIKRFEDIEEDFFDKKHWEK